MESLVVKWIKRRKNRKFVQRVLLWKHFLEGLRASINSRMKLLMKQNGTQTFDQVYDRVLLINLNDPRWRNLPLDKNRSTLYRFAKEKWRREKDKSKKIASLQTRLDRIKRQYGVDTIKDRKLL